MLGDKMDSSFFWVASPSSNIGGLLLALFLLPVSLTMHDFWSDEDAQARQSNGVQFSKDLALLGAALTLLMIPERWALSLGL